MELIVRNVTHAYADDVALSGVSLTAGPGLLALLGPNGSGKSTLLRLLATVSRPDSGQISFGGRSFDQDPRPVRQVLGYLPQYLELPGHLTPLGFLQYMARLKGLPSGDQPGALLDSLGLAAEAGRRIDQLSGGQVRRIGIAQALLGAPRLLVLDEPTAGLDPEERDRVLRLINRPAAGRVVILSSHLPGEVEAMASRIVVLHQGRVAYSGSVEQLLRTIEGQVQQFTVPAGEVERYLQAYRISRVTPRGAGATLRAVGEPPPGVGAELVQGSLEDAYLLLQSPRDEQ